MILECLNLRSVAIFSGILTITCSDPLSPGRTGEIDLGFPFTSAHPVWSAGPISRADLVRLRDNACVTSSSPGIPEPHTLEFVIDVSGSMSLPPETGTTIKWHTTRDALKDAVSTLPDSTHLGVVFFPNQATERNCENEFGPCVFGKPLAPSACVNLDGIFGIVDLGIVGSTERAAFDEAVDQINPAGGTPTRDAYGIAVERLSLPDAPEPKTILLLTDGQPTFLEGCVGSGNAEDPVDEQSVVDVISAARAQGIETYIIGSPGSEKNLGTGQNARPWLSRAAQAGGTARPMCDDLGPDYCHFDLSEETDFNRGLTEALDQILGQISPCQFPVPHPDQGTIDPAKINVILHEADGTAQIIGRAPNDGPCREGFRLNDDGTAVLLCETTCEQRRTSVRNRLELLFGCESTPIQPPK